MQYTRHIPLFLFSILCVKLLVVGTLWTDAPIFLILGAVSAFFEYKTSEKEMDAMRKTIDKQNEAILLGAKALDDVRSKVMSMQLASGMRTTNVGRV